MKQFSNTIAGNSEIASEIRFPRLHLFTALTLTVMVILFFILEFYKLVFTQFVIREQLTVYGYSTLPVVIIVMMLIIALTAWLATIRALHLSQKILLTNNAERKKTEETLRLSETYYRELLDNANDLFYTTDLRGNFTSFNKVGERITGYTRNEAISKNIVDVIAPDYLRIVRQMTVRKLKGESATTYELEILAKDNRRIRIEVEYQTDL